ncbi:MAG: poly-gamma-glutamate system protein [Flavobacteriia bacterium]|nr:poly-gamma-glutamate system protein [Flavobacteriia bacterium]
MKAKISIRSTFILSAMAILSISLFLIIEKTKRNEKEEWFDEKIEAVNLAAQAMKHLKNFRYKDVEFVENINDPNETGLIGEQYTSITTGNGSLPIKLSTLNPNIAAIIVEMLKESNVKQGDYVAVCMTGSFPGMNISTMAAIQTLKLKPILISSVTSSSWGANNPDFTWLDMEGELYRSKIFLNRSIAASIGGNFDIGRGLSLEGRDIVLDAMKRNHQKQINGKDVFENINKRMYLFKKKSKNQIKAFINVGGGVASIGSEQNGENVPTGLNHHLKLKRLKDKKGVIFEMAKQDVPIIHLLRLEGLFDKYEIPIDPTPMPKKGEGKIFYSMKYQVSIVLPFLMLIVSLLLVIIYIDKKQNALGKEIVKSN